MRHPNWHSLSLIGLGSALIVLNISSANELNNLDELLSNSPFGPAASIDCLPSTKVNFTGYAWEDRECFFSITFETAGNRANHYWLQIDQEESGLKVLAFDEESEKLVISYLGKTEVLSLLNRTATRELDGMQNRPPRPMPAVLG